MCSTARATVADLQFAHDRNVVFALAGNDTGTATSANVQIDRHAPLLWRVERRMAVKRRQIGRLFFVARDLFHEIIVRAIFLERRLAHEPAAFDAPMILRDR